MKSKYAVCAMLAATVLGGAVMWNNVWGQPAPYPAVVPATVRTAVCDVALVFEQYRRAQELTGEFQKRQVSMQAEDQSRRDAIVKLQGKLELLNPDSAEYEKVLDEVRKLTLEHRVWREFEEGQLVRRHRLLTEQMYNEILATVEAYARENGIGLVLYKDVLDLKSGSTAELQLKIAQRKVLYSESALDITTPVLRRLDEQYVPRGN